MFQAEEEAHKTEVWNIQRALPGLAWLEFMIEEREGRLGMVMVHDECHAGVWSPSVDGGDRHNGPRSTVVIHSDLHFRIPVAAK